MQLPPRLVRVLLVMRITMKFMKKKKTMMMMMLMMMMVMILMTTTTSTASVFLLRLG
jgi:uncharacterized membrane protein YwzB